MKIRKSRDSWRLVMLSLPGAVNLSEAGGGGKTWKGLREEMTAFVSD
jgi:hypothetical protein